MTDYASNNSGVTNRRQGSEWYVCDRCGHPYPRSKMVNQNGLNVCKGVDTAQCYDQRGHAANINNLVIPYEEVPQPLPWESTDL